MTARWALPKPLDQLGGDDAGHARRASRGRATQDGGVVAQRLGVGPAPRVNMRSWSSRRRRLACSQTAAQRCPSTASAGEERPPGPARRPPGRPGAFKPGRDAPSRRRSRRAVARGGTAAISSSARQGRDAPPQRQLAQPGGDEDAVLAPSSGARSAMVPTATRSRRSRTSGSDRPTGRRSGRPSRSGRAQRGATTKKDSPTEAQAAEGIAGVGAGGGFRSAMAGCSAPSGTWWWSTTMTAMPRAPAPPRMAGRVAGAAVDGDD